MSRHSHFGVVMDEPLAQESVRRAPGGHEKKIKGRFSRAQIIEILKAREKGTTIAELCRQYGMSPTTFYKWQAKFAGVNWGESSPDSSRIAVLEEENRRLKELLGETALEVSVLRQMLAKSSSN